MMHRKIYTLLLGIFFSLTAFQAQSQKAAVKTRILFIFDESNSMTAHWQSERKIEVAKKLMIKLVDSLKDVENVEMALRMYGHQSPVPPQDCGDTRLEVPFSPNNEFQIRQKLKITQPKGTTPIARSLEAAAGDFPDCNNCRNVIILITDGIEACDGDPCAVAMGLQSKGILLEPFIIGIGLDVEFADAFDCVGQFYNAGSEEDFENILQQVVKKAITGTTAQINLLDNFDRVKETDVNITLYNHKDGKPIRSFIHTMNYRGKPDTLSLPAHITYDMTVHTIPPVHKKNISITEGKHNIIEAKTPQGSINIIQNNGLKLKGIAAIVRKSGEMKTLNVQRVFEPEKYIVGRYDIEVLTYPRTHFNNVEVTQSRTTSLQIKQPGIVNFKFPAKGYGGVYLVKNDKVSLVTRFTEIHDEQITLQPGHYIAVFRTKEANLTSFSKERHIVVYPGQSTIVDFR